MSDNPQSAKPPIEGYALLPGEPRHAPPCSPKNFADITIFSEKPPQDKSSYPEHPLFAKLREMAEQVSTAGIGKPVIYLGVVPPKIAAGKGYLGGTYQGPNGKLVFAIVDENNLCDFLARLDPRRMYSC